MDFDNEVMNFDNANFDSVNEISFDLGIDNEMIPPKYEQIELEKELDGRLQVFKKAINENNRRISKQTDAGTYVVIMFQIQEQRDKFLESLGWDELLVDEYFINGLQLSAELEIELERIELPNNRFRKLGQIDII